LRSNREARGKFRLRNVTPRKFSLATQKMCERILKPPKPFRSELNPFPEDLIPKGFPWGIGGRIPLPHLIEGVKFVSREGNCFEGTRNIERPGPKPFEEWNPQN